ncbi:hypothetical protein M2401_000824 [Pseudomonas sp. JUb42]|uniref:hypothetical protein n=1 Tax=Pseudomonas sp. JUb42 TaxID=2940611 RepID=UPI0021675ACD|nr:hypothetical protein [Pseudomonas sp. JUb42]MCS3467103.1 hypothetical protein [Pseudomonas sp. JUb42]
MRINSARQAWHDCTYNPAPGQSSDVVQLGVVVQSTERGPTANHAMHSALAGHIQSAISRLHPQVRVFGEYMYAASRSDDIREAAEEVVFGLVVSKSKRMTAAKREKLEYVVKGVMKRYRYMHQGGQSANADPMIKPESFRTWLVAEYGIRIESFNWERDWEPGIRLAFDCCEDLDRMALSPIGAVIYQMKEAA